MATTTTTTIGITPEGQFVEFVVQPVEQAQGIHDAEEEGEIQMATALDLTQRVVSDWIKRTFYFETEALIAQLQKKFRCKRTPLTKPVLDEAFQEYWESSQTLYRQKPKYGHVRKPKELMRSMATILLEEIIPNLSEYALQTKASATGGRQRHAHRNKA
jgi:hypothetical protein